MSLLPCKDCKKEFSTDAKRCPHCGAKKPNPHYIIKGLLIAFFVSCLIHGITGRNNVATDSPPAPANSVQTEAQQSTQWQYQSYKDDMTGKEGNEASIDSVNVLSLEFPYNGIQHANLTLRTHPRYGKRVIVSIEKEQILCQYGGCYVLVRFDDAPPAHFAAFGAKDNSTNIIFIHDYASFVSKMRKAKKVRIEAEFYQNGSQTLEFDTSKFNPAQYKTP